MDRPTHAGGIVFRPEDARVLLVRANPYPHDWVIPKGRIEHGETPEETAVREIREEAGVVASVETPLGLVEFEKPNGRFARVACYLLTFVAESVADEDRETRWCTFDEAMMLVPFENTRTIFMRARAILRR